MSFLKGKRSEKIKSTKKNNLQTKPTERQTDETDMKKFEDVFWGTSNDPLLGLRTLHKTHLQTLGDLEDLSSYLKDRQTIEDSYASRLSDLVSKAGPSRVQSQPGMGAGRGVLDCLKEEAGRVAGSHRDMANGIKDILKVRCDLFGNYFAKTLVLIFFVLIFMCLCFV
jgi:hypothetical protein